MIYWISDWIIVSETYRRAFIRLFSYGNIRIRRGFGGRTVPSNDDISIDLVFDRRLRNSSAEIYYKINNAFLLCAFYNCECHVHHSDSTILFWRIVILKYSFITLQKVQSISLAIADEHYQNTHDNLLEETKSYRLICAAEPFMWKFVCIQPNKQSTKCDWKSTHQNAKPANR